MNERKQTMKIEIIDNDYNVVLAKLKKITQYTITKNGGVTTIIVLHTDNGNFSNFIEIWKRQNIDPGLLNEGDLLEIKYTEYIAANGAIYKNFKEVSLMD